MTHPAVAGTVIGIRTTSSYKLVCVCLRLHLESWSWSSADRVCALPVPALLETTCFTGAQQLWDQYAFSFQPLGLSLEPLAQKVMVLIRSSSLVRHYNRMTARTPEAYFSSTYTSPQIIHSDPQRYGSERGIGLDVLLPVPRLYESPTPLL